MMCLKRALKVANAAQQQLAMSAKRTGLSEPVRLYVDILNQYLFFFDQGVPNITVSVLQVRSCDLTAQFVASRPLLACTAAAQPSARDVRIPSHVRSPLPWMMSRDDLHDTCAQGTRDVLTSASSSTSALPHSVTRKSVFDVR